MTPQSPTATEGRSSPKSAPVSDAVEFDLFRLDCAIDALRGQNLSPYRETLRRIADNFADLTETTQ